MLRFETGQRVKVYTCLLEMGQKEPYNGLIAEVGNAFVDVILVAHSHYVGKAESVLFRVRNKSLAVFRFYERDILSGVVRIDKED